MIESSSIGNSDVQAFARHRAAADALEPHRAAKALAQHLHQIGAEAIAGFFRRDQKDLPLHPGGVARRRHAGKPWMNRPALIGGLDHGLRVGGDGVAGDRRRCRQARPWRRPRWFWRPRSAGRSADPGRSWAPSPARRGRAWRECGPRSRSRATRASSPSVPSMSSTATTWPSITTTAWPISKGPSAPQHLAAPWRYRRWQPDRAWRG